MTLNAAPWQPVLDFWFGPDAPDAEVAAQRQAFWFRGDPALDASIGERFRETVEQAARGELEAWSGEPRGRLAVILLLDQFTRNIHRGTPDAFRFDPQALAHSLEGQSRGQDRALRPIERVFFYMPMEHAESLPVQDESVHRFEALLAEVDEPARPAFENFLDYARAHRDVVLRFGRFPHRNAILGRESTPEEAAFLLEDGSSF